MPQTTPPCKASPLMMQVREKIRKARKASEVRFPHHLMLYSYHPPHCSTPGESILHATRSIWCVAQVWRKAPFRKRRLLLKVLQQYIIEHQDEICRYASSSAPCRHARCNLSWASSLGTSNPHPSLQCSTRHWTTAAHVTRLWPLRPYDEFGCQRSLQQEPVCQAPLKHPKQGKNTTGKHRGTRASQWWMLHLGR